MNVFDKPVIFVGGAPRSGTTVAQALLCTSERTNRYCPEASFLLPLFNAYRIGIEHWTIHTVAFYQSQEAFSERIREYVRMSLADISRATGNPEVLCVKDPLLTALFYWVYKLLGDQAKFVTVVRTPYDIVRSRQEVSEKDGRPLTKADARAVAAEINRSYAHLNIDEMREVVFALRYEDLTQPKIIEALRAFTALPDISPEKVWSEGADVRQSAQKDPWFSPKYHRPINFEKRLEPLRFKFRRIVRKECGALIERFGYDATSAPSLARFRQSLA